jgi:uncharacterized membrane protein YidH (DUF202 family)
MGIRNRISRRWVRISLLVFVAGCTLVLLGFFVVGWDMMFPRDTSDETPTISPDVGTAGIVVLTGLVTAVAGLVSALAALLTAVVAMRNKPQLTPRVSGMLTSEVITAERRAEDLEW